MYTVILGLGNALLADEGVGVHAVRLLQERTLPESVEVVEIGTAILDALPFLEKAERIIIIDAMKGGEPPGTVYKTDFSQCSGATTIGSMHGFDIFRTMALAGRSDQPPTTIFGVEPDEISWSLELTPSVTASIPPLLKAVEKEITV